MKQYKDELFEKTKCFTSTKGNQLLPGFFFYRSLLCQTFPYFVSKILGTTRIFLSICLLSLLL